MTIDRNKLLKQIILAKTVSFEQNTLFWPKEFILAKYLVLVKILFFADGFMLVSVFRLPTKYITEIFIEG